MRPVPVYIESTPRRCFAGSLDWPGWCRAGRDDSAALAAFADCAPRYAQVVRRAGQEFDLTAAKHLEVVQRLAGTGTTAFGAPDGHPDADARPLDQHEAHRQVALLEAAWAFLDEVVAAAPEFLRKGPRGGGRDRDKVLAHVLEAEFSYARKIGVKAIWGGPDDVAGVRHMRERLVAALDRPHAGDQPDPRAWLPRYALRRVVWHVLDHAWEIQDRDPGNAH